MYGRSEKGFSLVELVVVIGLIGIISVIAVPNFLSWLPNMHVKAYARDVFSAFMTAKGEAVKRNVQCGVSFNMNVNGALQAYVVYEDTNNDFQYNVGEPIIIQQPNLNQLPNWSRDVRLDIAQGGGTGLTVTPDAAGFPAVFFTVKGMPVTFGGLLPGGAVFLTNTNGYTRRIVINATGSLAIRQ